ncbi:alpha/beta hydrolase [bacterium]|jgi:pimeloyl-ACP methyl ester carboxylesterase|nr:alpha/beta hydrolase [bacterium]
MKVFKANIDNIQTRYCLSGNPNSPKTILILHGWGSSLDSWRSLLQMADTRASDFNFVFFEFPGFGLTQKPPKAWQLGDFVDFSSKFLEYLQKKHSLKPSYILCHSFGARVATQLLSQPKHNYLAAIFLAPAIIKHELNFLQRLSKKIGPKLQFLHKFKFTSYLVKQYRRLIGAYDYNKLAGSMKQTFENVVSTNSEPFLPKIKIPILLVWGTKDVLTPVKMSKKAHMLLENSILKVIPGMTHGIHIHLPEEVFSWCLKTFK